MKEKKNCPCLQRLREAVINNSKDSERPVVGLVFDLSRIENMRTDKGMLKTAQKVWIREIHTKKDGTQTEKERVSFMTHNYCPFCGTKFID